MKPSILPVLLAIASIPSASAQVSVGYGVGYFPNGLRPVNNWVSNFNNNPDLDFSFGPIFHAGNLLPFYHGVTASWSKPVKENSSLKFNVDFQNLHNRAQSIRVNWQSTHLYHRINSGMNSLYIGAEKSLQGKGLLPQLFSSWIVRGYVSNYQLKYSIGEGEAYSKKWHNKLSLFDFGLDLGAYLYSSSRARVLVHYSHSLMQYTSVKTSNTESTGYYPTVFVPKTSYAGIKLQISLGKCACRNTEEADPQPTVTSASVNE